MHITKLSIAQFDLISKASHITGPNYFQTQEMKTTFSNQMSLDSKLK